MTTMTWSAPVYESVARLVAQRAGLALPDHRARSTEAGIRRAMARAGTHDPARYRLLLERDSDALDDLLVELTVGETYFFRDAGQLDVIRRQVLPEIRARRGREHVLRVWSAGCASGEEAYSLAILLAEEGLAQQSQIHATDISRAALAKARRAVYSDWSLRGEGAAATRLYVRSAGGSHAVVDNIQRAVTFRHLNLALDVYPSLATGIWSLDLILCRNVLVYLDRETTRRVARRLHASLADGGWLVTAPSDPMLLEDAPFETVMTSAGIFYRRAVAAHPSLHVVRPRSSASPVAADADDPIEWTLPSPPADETTLSSRVAEAAAALGRREYTRVVELTRDHADEAATSVLLVRALANLDVDDAERVCGEAVRRHERSSHLHALWALLLLELGRDDEAAAAARRALYLDTDLVVAHFTLATILRRLGDTAGAARGYRHARDLCAARPPDEVVPLADGERCGRLAEAADAQLAMVAGEGKAE